MKGNNYIHESEFVIENYSRVRAFSSFLPSISGVNGKPMWIFYVNRGQCIASMGINNKDYSIMEFLPANKAYRHATLQGFRTFLKIYDLDNGEAAFYEPFGNQMHLPGYKTEQRMYIASHKLRIEEIDAVTGIKTEVEYCTLPGESFPAFIRKVRITNGSGRRYRIEMLDGLPVIIPYHIEEFRVKNESWITQAWMRVENYLEIPFYKTGILPGDMTRVTAVMGGFFYMNFDFISGKTVRNPVVIDPELIFENFTDFSYPGGFVKEEFAVPDTQINQGITPCGFGYRKLILQPGEESINYSMLGFRDHYESLRSFANHTLSKEYMDDKLEEARILIESIKSNILTVGGCAEFDLYCGQTFLDNVVRGGMPVAIGGGKHVFHLYSRKHGDLERDYNFFQTSSTYYSQGNGNYRDISQNRRNDARFFPFSGASGIRVFMNLIQLDGFNPLELDVVKFKPCDKDAMESILSQDLNEKDRELVSEFLEEPVAPGHLLEYLEVVVPSLTGDERAALFDRIIEGCARVEAFNFKEGYWSDHWTYNTDLLEAYASVFPERTRDLLLNDRSFSYYDTCFMVQPRHLKHILAGDKVRRAHAVVEDAGKRELIQSRADDRHLVRTDYGKGGVYRITLMGKLFGLIVNKAASLDPGGIGMEMEADKPGWCDALNGLPGLLGSSLNECVELKRLCGLILELLKQGGVQEGRTIGIPVELMKFYNEIHRLLANDIGGYSYWDLSNNAKETFRQETRLGLSGSEDTLSMKSMKEFLEMVKCKMDESIRKAYNQVTGLPYTYFINEASAYEPVEGADGKGLLNEEGLQYVRILEFVQKPMALFLEGPMNVLRVERDEEKARSLYHAVKKSGLYDKKLRMYRVNEDLKDEPYEVGRIKAFPRGWLENEAVFLHMHYKYLFAMLRAGLREEFFEEAVNGGLVPFLKPEIYGRSILENCSFIAGSTHPDPKLHGGGFVARLSGSSAEFLSIWLYITSGETPFYLDTSGEMCLEFKPVLPAWIFTGSERTVEFYVDNKRMSLTIPENAFMFHFLGRIPVICRNPDKKNTFGKDGAVVRTIAVFEKECRHMAEGSRITGDLVEKVRMGAVERIELYFM